MTQDGKRRRGRRRGARRDEPGRARPAPEQQEQSGELEVEEQPDVPGVSGSRFSFRRRGSGDAPRKREARPKERAAASSTSSTSPMDFWRSGQARTYRDPRAQRKSMGLWQRIAGFHFPAWMPVATIMVVVMGILGLLFFVQSAKGAPRIGDHWHAPYSIYVGGELQPRIPELVTRQGIHTHGDGVIHLHPHTSVAEGGGARLEYFFRDQGGRLSDDELQIPGRSETYRNGDVLEGDDRPSELRILRADSGFHPLGANFSQAIVSCDSKPESEFQRVDSRYVPQDGDCIRIVFGPPEEVPVIEPDRTIIDPSQAQRQFDMTVTGSGADTVFTPSTIELKAGETVKVALANNSEVFQQGDQTIAPFHGLRFSGTDRQYGTSDDYVLPNIDPGTSGEVVIRFDAPGEYEFRDEQAVEGVTPVTGKVVVGEAEATPPPGASPTPAPADVSIDVSVTDTAFEPASLTVQAGKSFHINLTNTGTVIHNLRIAGPDGAFRTEDDVAMTTPVNPGASGQLIGKIDTPGTYQFRDDFNQTTLTGTLTVQ